ncbi:hypothetical protein SAMN05446037_1004136 [Anaerovirgula multivorans]|uniref:Uncharacterized protein n=1 Tax=Anaerovirgula multivorans TaxID=312168 RepID=A0A239BW18_9FIRM|nr:GHKL domain-containing protein [Anaerovirgula multivorans]SNS11353.1 hypothetical protein SAMN05446037_1004136 [Anaerovirgula multivorans]
MLFVNHNKMKLKTKIILLSKNIKDTNIAALLIGKSSIAKELGIHMNIHPASFISKLSDRIPSNLIITVLGNLIENAFDALQGMEEKKWVDILIKENNRDIILL